MFQIILSNTKEVIRIGTIDEVKKIFERIADGNNMVITSGGAFNPSYFVAILHNDKGTRDEAYMKNVGFKDGIVSPFAKLLSGHTMELENQEQRSG